MKRSLKLLSLVLAVCMVMTMLPMEASAAFADQDNIQEEYKEAAEVLSGLGIMTGTETDIFQPQDSLSRGELASILYQIIAGTHSEASTQSQLFGDVLANHHYAASIAYCVQNGLMDGYDDGNFYPTRKLTGYEVMSTLLRALGYDQNGEFQGEDWADKVASSAKELGLLTGFDHTFDMSTYITREQAANMLYNATQVPTVTYSGGSYVPSGATLGDNLGLEKAQSDYRDKEMAEENQNENATVIPIHQLRPDGELFYTAKLRPGQKIPEGTDNLVIQCFPIYGATGVARPTNVVLTSGLLQAATGAGAGLIVNTRDVAVGFDAGTLPPENEHLEIVFSYPDDEDHAVELSLPGAEEPVQAALVLRTGEALNSQAQLVDEDGKNLGISGVGLDRKSIYGSISIGKEPNRFTAKTNAKPLEVVPIEDILANVGRLSFITEKYNHPGGPINAYDIAAAMHVEFYFSKESLQKKPITLGELLDAAATETYRDMLEMAVQEAVTRYPELFPDGISKDDELTGEQLVAILAVLNEWYTDLSLLNPEVTEDAVNNAVPNHLIKRPKEAEWSYNVNEDGKIVTRYYMFNEDGILVEVDANTDADNIYKYENGSWSVDGDSLSGPPTPPEG